MTARKLTKTTTEEIETQAITTSGAMPDTGRPYILESAEFDAIVLSRRKTAAREIDELDAEVERLQIEINARLSRREDLMKIVIKADAVINMKDVTPTAQPTTAPKLVFKDGSNG